MGCAEELRPAANPKSIPLPAWAMSVERYHVLNWKTAPESVVLVPTDLRQSRSASCSHRVHLCPLIVSVNN
jgi:hypothetical protein